MKFKFFKSIFSNSLDSLSSPSKFQSYKIKNKEEESKEEIKLKKKRIELQ
jgi:hypothetical protein